MCTNFLYIKPSGNSETSISFSSFSGAGVSYSISYNISEFEFIEKISHFTSLSSNSVFSTTLRDDKDFLLVMSFTLLTLALTGNLILASMFDTLTSVGLFIFTNFFHKTGLPISAFP